MAQENIDFGDYPNDANADAIRSAFQKAQNNFTELYGVTLATGVTSVTTGSGLKQNTTTGNIILSANIPNITIQTDTNILVGVSTATGNSATITSGNTPFAFKLSNTITVANLFASNVSGTLITSAQPNITSVGTLTSVSVSGNATASNFIGNFIGNVTSSRITAPGSDSQLLFNKVGIINAISNVTFTGSTLNIIGGISATSNITAAHFIGSGNTLSNIQASNITGIIANANYAAYAGNVITSSQPNITSLGTLTGLTVQGNVLPAEDITYNLGSYSNAWKELWISGGTVMMKTAGGNASIAANNTSVTITNPVGGRLLLKGSIDYDGTSLYNGTSNVRVYENSDVAISVAGVSNTTVINSSGIVTAGNITSVNANLGNVVNANYFIGDGSLLTNINITNVLGTVSYATTAGSANTAATITTNAQPNITSVGTLTSANITGSLTAGNANLGNAVTANYFIGSGNNLSNIAAANIIGTVANATYAVSAAIADSATTAATVTTNAQPNITSLGTLTSLAVSGNVTSTNANLGNAVRASYFIGNGVYLSSISNTAIVGSVANADYASRSGNAATAVYAISSGYTDTVTVGVQPNITSVGTLTRLNISGNLTVSGITDLGSVSNIRIAGGTNGYVLQTDGYGTLSWVLPSSGGGSAGNPGGSNTQLQFNDSGLFGGHSGLTYNKSTGILNSTLISGALTTAAQPNITTVGRLSSLVVGNATSNTVFGNGTITASGNINVGSNYLLGNGYYLTGITIPPSDTTSINNGSSNISIPVNSGNINMSVGGLANIIVVNSVNGMRISHNIEATKFIGNGYLLSNINGSNIISTVANANYAAYAGNVTLAAQPNITSVGRLSSLSVGNATSNTVFGNGTITASGNISAGSTAGANYILGNGYYLTGLSASTSVSNGSSNVSIPLINSDVLISAGGISDVLVINTSGINVKGIANVSGNLSATNANLGNLVTATYFKGSGNLLSNIQASNIFGNVASANSANVSYRANTQTVSTGMYYPLIVDSLSGNLITHTQANLGYNADSATLYSTYLNGTLTIASAIQPNITTLGTLTNLNVSGNISAGNANLGNAVRASYFIGNGNYLSNIPAANIIGSIGSATTAATVTTAAQPNITSVGTLTSLAVTGNITSTNANLGNAVNANYFIGNGNYLSNISAANIIGTIANATYALNAGTATTAATVTTNAQPNITSVGTLTSVTSSGNVQANNFIGNGYQLTNILGTNITGTVPSATTAATVTTASQPNITNVGTLTSLTVNGSTNLGSISNITITGGSTGTVLTTNGSGGLSWAAGPSGTIVQTRTAVSGPTIQTIPNQGIIMALTDLVIPITPKAATSKIWIQSSILGGATYPFGLAVYRSDRFISLSGATITVSGASASVLAYNSTSFGTQLVTVTTQSPHNLVVGNIVYLANIRQGAGLSNVNGSFSVKTVTSTTFTAVWYPRKYGDLIYNGAQIVTSDSILYTMIPTVVNPANAATGPTNKSYANLNITIWPESSAVSTIQTFNHFEIAENTNLRYYHVLGLSTWAGVNYILYINNRPGADMAGFSTMLIQEIAA